MSQAIIEVIILFLLIIGNGAFAMAEIALVSARRSRLKSLAHEGRPGGQAALDLAESPNRFLATVQIGISLVGILSGAYGGATLGEKLAQHLLSMDVPDQFARPLGIGTVVLSITYLSLVLGELVPKRLAMGHPETISLLVSRPMTAIAKFGGPLVSFLSWSTDSLLRLLGIKPVEDNKVSEEEVKMLLHEGLRSGVFLPAESAMVESVLALDRLPVCDIMTPRAKLIWISVDESPEMLWHKIVISGHTTYPVYEHSRDQLLGMVSLKEIYANLAAGVDIVIKNLMTPPLVVPSTQSAINLLEAFKKSGKHVALVTDEFGSMVGLVSLHDVMEAIVGDFPTQDDRLKPTVKQRDDGTWLVDGMIDVATFLKLVPDFPLDPPAGRDYETFGGYVVKKLGHVPAEGEWFEQHNYRIEVIDMDRHRVDKLLLMRSTSPWHPGKKGA